MSRSVLELPKQTDVQTYRSCLVEGPALCPASFGTKGRWEGRFENIPQRVCRKHTQHIMARSLSSEIIEIIRGCIKILQYWYKPQAPFKWSGMNIGLNLCDQIVTELTPLSLPLRLTSSPSQARRKRMQGQSSPEMNYKDDLILLKVRYQSGTFLFWDLTFLSPKFKYGIWSSCWPK